MAICPLGLKAEGLEVDYGLAKDDELIDVIYGAMLGETTWQDFLERLSDNAPFGRTVMFSHNMNQADDYLAMAACFEAGQLESYAAHYIDQNPWSDSCAVRKVGLGVISDEIVPPQDMVGTEFYEDWMVPNDVAASVGVTIDKSGTCPLIISTVTSRDDPEANKAFSDQMSRIAPHLNRAARFYRQGAGKWSGFALGASLFDAVNIGVIILGEDGRAKSVSATAQQMAHQGVRINPMGQLALRDEAAQAALKAMLKRVYDGPKSYSLFAGGLKLTLLRVEKDRISLYFEGPTVVILMERHGRGQNLIDLGSFAETYRLTSAEQRALAGVVAGKSVAEIAEEAGVSRETIRTQLKRLYAKTSVNGQADLVRLVHDPIFGRGYSLPPDLRGRCRSR